jgi:hypothetical protein
LIEHVNDRFTLQRSQAGMRLIAQMTIYNSGDFRRLRTYIRESYHASALETESLAERIAIFRQMYAALGRLRIRQIIAADPHHVVVLLEAEKSDSLFLNDVEVDAEHPHQITAYSHVPLEGK